jgi:hypothetical protein
MARRGELRARRGEFMARRGELRARGGTCWGAVEEEPSLEKARWGKLGPEGVTSGPEAVN